MLGSHAVNAATVSVSVEGVEPELRENILAFLEINRLVGREDLGELVVRLQHRKAPNNIRAALRPLGFYQVTVESELAADGDNWRARYKVMAGNRVVVRSVAVSVQGPGDSDPAFAKLIGRVAPKPGDGLRHDRYEELKRGLQSLAVERGYFEAQFVQRRLDVFPAQLSADIELVMASGPRYRIGEILVDQSALNEALLRRYLSFSSGDYFDSARLLNLQYALYDSEYFAFVEVSNGRPDMARQVVPVTIRAEAGKRQRYRVGIGYGTDTEGRVSFGWENRRINRRGHKLLLDTRLSSIKQEIAGRYVLPLSAPTRERLTLSASGLQETLADTRSRRLELGITQTTLREHWERDVYLRLIREDTRELGVTDTETLLLPGAVWLRSKGDDPVFPRKGSRLSVEVRGSHSALGSDVDFVQLRLQGRLIYPVGRRSRLLARGELGATSVGENSRLPASLRFFAGGDQSVRGFGLNTLGPRDENGLVLGGRYLLAGSLEFEHLFTQRWGFAVFADAGNALQELDESLEYSAGLGLRWLSPVGMLRLDIAKPLSDDNQGLRLHLSLGAEL